MTPSLARAEDAGAGPPAAEAPAVVAPAAVPAPRKAQQKKVAAASARKVTDGRSAAITPAKTDPRAAPPSVASTSVASTSAASSTPPGPGAAEAPPPVQARSPQASSEPTGEFEPVLHARNAKIGVCMDNIVAQSGRVIDRPHKAVSTWVTAAPDDNVFQSIVGLSYPSKVAPNGAAIILAAPLTAKKCEGQGVQIFPTAQSCTAVQAGLVRANAGRTLATLQDLPLIEMKDGSRDLLMPSAGGGCVLVAIRLR